MQVAEAAVTEDVGVLVRRSGAEKLVWGSLRTASGVTSPCLAVAAASRLSSTASVADDDAATRSTPEGQPVSHHQVLQETPSPTVPVRSDA